MCWTLNVLDRRYLFWGHGHPYKSPLQGGRANERHVRLASSWTSYIDVRGRAQQVAFCVVLVYILCVLLKFASVVEQNPIKLAMGQDMERKNMVDPVTFGSLLLACMVVSTVIAGTLLVS